MIYESTYYGVAGLGDDTLAHHGIKGQKWGVRRYQNADGSFTDAGKKRYYRQQVRETRRDHKAIDSEYVQGWKDLRRVEKAHYKELRNRKQNGTLTKEQYKKSKKYAKAEMRRARDELENRAVIEHYKAIKRLRLDKAVLEKDIHGIDSKQFKKAEKKYKREWESLGNYQVTRKPDGSWQIVRFDYYY